MAGDALRALNNAHARETSHLSAADWAGLVAQAFAALAILSGSDAAPEGFVVALDQDADYASPNFVWFRERFERFVYVDRVVVAAAARGRGHARQLYGAVATVARAAGHARIVCEVNQRPPNPGSDAFHAALGFVPLATRALASDKTVRYLALDLALVGDR